MRRGARGAPVLALGAAAVIACSDGPTPPVRGDEPIRTDAVEYVLERVEDRLVGEIGYVFANRTGQAVYVVNCNGAFGLQLERWTGEEWEYAWSPALPECLSPPIVIRTGNTLRRTLAVSGRFERDDPAGLYRIVWVAALSDYETGRYPFGDQIPLEDRVSNAFSLTVD